MPTTHRDAHLFDHERACNVELERQRRSLEERLSASEAGRGASAKEVGRLAALVREVQVASERALAEQKERLQARLRRALAESVVVNVPSFVLGKEARSRAVERGEPEVIDPGDVDRLTLSLEVVDPAPYPRYRLRVVPKAGGEEVWQTDELSKVSGSWLRLDLPAGLFEAGEYEFLIYGLGSDGPRLLTERYVVKFED